MDVCMFNSQNFAFVSFPDAFTTGSSIMPHKKNPDVFEIMRGKCNRLQSIPGELSLLNANLPMGYNRDLQLMKDILFPAFDTLRQCIDMCILMLDHIIVNRNAAADSRYDYMFTVEEVNRRVLAGEPFRDAYREVGIEVNEGRFKPVREVHHTHAGSIGNLCTEAIRLKMQSQLDKLS